MSAPLQGFLVDAPVVLIVRAAFPAVVWRGEGQELLRRAINQLPHPGVVLSLAGIAGVDDLSWTNVLGVDVHGTPHMGLFPDVSRINHAYKGISPGEEISISYIGWGEAYRSRPRRSRSPCSSPAAMDASDIQWDRTAATRRALAEDDLVSNQVAVLAQQLVRLLETGDLALKPGGQLGAIGVCLQGVGHITSAGRHANLALENCIEYAGVEHEGLWAIRAFLEELKMRTMQTG
ncbi:Uu.00g131720.m01.CDS01 [Anthostomella pinea]|uniref:Uu.00g131720.m01.CDS01 n=1 Tax=Anthostomella pinea TaxID=933095 RepID=A0AAI8VIY8_9PEZI|nr:Uu.00g131720.m01.CDS01 [Anthostomella pinea]